MPGRSGDWWLLTSHSQLLIPAFKLLAAVSPTKKESQPRLAALGSPFQGKGLAWIHPPSYGRRCPEGAEVGWREAVFPYHSLPRVGKVASGASRIGF